MDEGYDALVTRVQSDPDSELTVTRTRRGVTVEHEGERLELVGDEPAFRRYVFALSRETKSSFGHQDGMALLVTHIEESLYSESTDSSRWAFTTGKSNKPIVKETPLEP